MARLLIISYSYAPAVTPRALRWHVVAKELRARGHQVDVLTAGPDTTTTQLDGITVYTVPERGFGAFVRRFFHRATHTVTTTDVATAAPAGAQGNGGLLKFAFRLVRAVHKRTWQKLYWPDSTHAWIRPATQKALSLIAAQQYDRLISVSLPFSAHVVAAQVKNSQPGLFWLMDMGDPFSLEHAMPLNHQHLWQAKNFATEQRYLQQAAAISVTTDLTKKAYSDAFGAFVGDKVRVIPPLYTARQQPRPTPFTTGNKLRLVYTGSLHKAIRRPNELLALFAKLLDTQLSKRLELHIVGPENDASSDFLPYQRLEQSGKLYRHGPVPHQQAQAFQQHADVLVNIGNATPYQLPSKVVDYLASGKPILNLAQHPDDSAAAFFADYPRALTLLPPLDIAQVDTVVRFLLRPLPELDGARQTQRLHSHTPAAIGDAYNNLLQLSNVT